MKQLARKYNALQNELTAKPEMKIALYMSLYFILAAILSLNFLINSPA